MRRSLLGLGLLLPLGASADEAAQLRDWFRAIEFDHAASVRTRLAAGQDPNQRSERGQPALHWALMHQSAQVVELLVREPKVDVERLNQAGESALMLAALRARLDWVKALVARGAQIDPEPGAKRWRALHYAASGEDGGVCDWLLKQGAAIDARAPNGATALMMAAGHGALDAVRLLLQRGADAQLRDESGRSAWDYAVKGGREDLARRAGLRPPA